MGVGLTGQTVTRIQILAGEGLFFAGTGRGYLALNNLDAAAAARAFPTTKTDEMGAELTGRVEKGVGR